MHNNTTIYNELKELNSPLADISNVNVYKAPAGYFASLSSVILQAVHDRNGLDELDIPVLEMKVPEGYFDGLADSIMDKIKSVEISEVKATYPAFLDGTRENNVYKIPADYFEGLPAAIMTKINAVDGSRLEEFPSFLAPLQDKQVFTVPAGYFDGLAEEILSKIPKQEAKVINLKYRSSIFRYAIAAGITGILGLSLFSNFDNKTRRENILPSSGNTITALAADILKNNSFDKTMETLGDDEIVSYLKNDGEDVNAALVASVTDEKTLPEEDAYFMDEKTLDNFLTEQHAAQPGNN